MRFIDKLISFIFNVFVIVIAVSILLVLTGFVNYPVIEGILKDYVFNDSYKTIVLSATILVILAGLKTTVFASTLSSTAKKNIMVDTPHGKIQINQDTIENVAKSVIAEYDSIKEVKTGMTKAKNGINMFMMLSVYQNTNIKDVVMKVQNEVKEQIEETTSVIVRNVDVKVKNVARPTNNKKANNVSKPDKSVASTTSTIPQAAGENKVNKNDPSTYIAETPTGELKKDENDVLYSVEANPNSTFNSEEN